jgi:hypothetical protein
MERVDHVVDQVPVLAWSRTRVYEIETGLWHTLRNQLLPADASTSSLLSLPFTPAPRHVVPSPMANDDSCDPIVSFAALLRAAETQSPDAARRQAMMRIIDDLVPDESRILFAMSNGSQHAVLQVDDGDDRIISNRSSVGRTAKVHAQELTTRYVAHLLELGLIELARYEGRSFYEWELIESESEVREVLRLYDHRKLKKPKMIRQILRLSPAGRALCDLCIPS